MSDLVVRYVANGVDRGNKYIQRCHDTYQTILISLIIHFHFVVKIETQSMPTTTDVDQDEVYNIMW
jgi:hypothetical protein